MSLNEDDSDERTIYVGNLSEKTTEQLLRELFYQAGPVERVCIPKDKDKGGANKNFGFVTYKQKIAVSYALSIFNGTKLYGRELTLKNRSTNSSNRNSLSNQNHNQSVPNTLTLSYLSNPLINAIYNDDMIPMSNPFVPQLSADQQLFQQQLLQLNYAMQVYNQNNSDTSFPSQRIDNIGSQRERDLVDRNRYHRDEERNNRSKPYRRSRSPPPPPPPHRNNRDRSRSPISNRRDNRDRNAQKKRRYWTKHN